MLLSAESHADEFIGSSLLLLLDDIPLDSMSELTCTSLLIKDVDFMLEDSLWYLYLQSKSSLYIRSSSSTAFPILVIRHLLRARTER